MSTHHLDPSSHLSTLPLTARATASPLGRLLARLTVVAVLTAAILGGWLVEHGRSGAVHHTVRPLSVSLPHDGGASMTDHPSGVLQASIGPFGIIQP